MKKKKDAQLLIRVSAEEKQVIKDAALVIGQTMSDYVRTVLVTASKGVFESDRA